MTIVEMQEKKIELGFTNQILADNSGVPLGTVQKIMAGVTLAPRKKTLEALEMALVEGERKKKELGEKVKEEAELLTSLNEQADQKEHPHHRYSADEVLSADGVKEKSGIYSISRKGYTVDDYAALPDDKRVELIDGTFYDMSTPTHMHQLVTSSLWKEFDNYIDKTGSRCIAIASPVDVQLDGDEWTVVQPDVMVVCDREKFLKNGRITGSPDLVIEVLSPTTQRKDKFLKYYKYGNAGVKEYWIVDLEKRLIRVIHFGSEQPTSVYHFDDQIPVEIWKNQCVIDFKKIYAKIAFLLEG
ncbi:MAG: Uma2 family endonuclease [Dorea sp.]|nr:Uma2 family endonuclease [Dorea sp.]